MDLFLIAAFVLAVAGVAGSVVPLVPGAALSAGGVLLYWWSTGYADPSGVFVAGVVLVALVALAADWFAGAIAAKAGGASTVTTAVAAAVGIALLFVAGPVGLIAGIAATVFLVEVAQGGDGRESARAAGYAVVGVLGSAAVQVVVTVGILAGFAVAVVV